MQMKMSAFDSLGSSHWSNSNEIELGILTQQLRTSPNGGPITKVQVDLGLEIENELDMVLIIRGDDDSYLGLKQIPAPQVALLPEKIPILVTREEWTTLLHESRPLEDRIAETIINHATDALKNAECVLETDEKGRLVATVSLNGEVIIQVVEGEGL